MAVNYYGKCTGKDGVKYDVWLNIKQNSQDKSLNTSNFSVGFYLKRNESSEDAVYSTTDENRVVLIVDGKVVVDEDIAIDTRNDATVTLAFWNGDVSHNENGDLNLAVSGSFSMNNNTISGGAVDAVFKSAAIPKASTLVINSTVVNPGDIIKADIECVSSEYSHRIAWGLGDQSVSVNYNPGITDVEFTIPVEWAEQIKDSCTGDFKIAIRTYYNSAIIGTNVYNLNFVIPETEEYMPEFRILLKKYDDVVPDDWNVWVQGISRIQVVPGNLKFKYGATISAITVTVGSVSKRSLPAVFELPEKGDITVTVAVRDSRGMLMVKNTIIEVNEYRAPSIDVRQLSRCTVDGTISSSGEYLFMDYVVGCSSVKMKNLYRVKVKYRPSDYGEFSGEYNISDRPAVFGDCDIKNDKSYVVSINISDAINTEGVEVIRFIPNGDIPFNIRKGGNGAAFGKYAKNENELSVKWNLSVDGDVSFAGALNFEKVEAQCTPLTENLFADIRYYPCLNAVFVRMRLVTATPLSANDTYYIATIPERVPGIFTPLNSLADFASGGQSTAGIMFKTGMVTFRSDVVIPKETTIYISGFYIADYLG